MAGLVARRSGPQSSATDERAPLKALQWIRAIGDALLPPACPACQGPAGRPEVAWLCWGCLLRVRPIPSPRCSRCWAPLGTGGSASAVCTECERWPPELGRVRSATLLEGPARILVHRLKYHGWNGLATPMSRAMAPLVETRTARWLVPIPTTPWRRRIRGYNQAERLASGLASTLQVPVLDALSRRTSRGTQVALPPHERLANVKRAFSLREQAVSRLREAHVVVVDDVLTTGATAAAATEALRDAGVASVSVITFARALPHRRALGCSPREK